jgi:ribonuclease J
MQTYSKNNYSNRNTESGQKNFRRGNFRNNFAQNNNRNTFEKVGKALTALKTDNIRIIPLGGVEECGKNMLAIEYMSSIIIINAGAQFSAAEVPGVDYIIPNISYLEENKDKIKGLILTTSLLEYTGALPFINEKINYPKIYARHFTNTLLEKRMSTLQIKGTDLKLNNELIPVEEDMNLSVGDFEIEFVDTKTSTPDAMNIKIKTKYGDIMYMSDTNDYISKKEDADKNDQNKILCLIAESLNSENGSETLKKENLKDALREIFVKKEPHRVGAIYIATFANNIFHILNVIELAREYKKKIIINSNTLSENIISAQEVGLLDDLKDILINAEDINKYKRDDLMYFVTGEEGKETQFLYSLLNAAEIKDDTYKNFALQLGDVVVIATHPIIHNQRAVQNLKDELSRAGAFILHYKYSDIIMSASGGVKELNKIHKDLEPTFFIPISGCHYMLRVHADIERKIGAPENHIIIPDNGMVIEIHDNGNRISNTREKVNTEIAVVDGNKIGKLHNVVLKDRETLGAQGVFFVITLIDMRNHKLKKLPDLATRGFVFLKESQELLVNTRDLSKNIIENYLDRNPHIEIDDLKEIMQKELAKYLMQKTAKQPVIIPIIIRV